MIEALGNEEYEMRLGRVAEVGDEGQGDWI